MPDNVQDSLPRPVVEQPDPMLDAEPAGVFRVGLTLLGAAAVVVMVLYGLTRPAEAPQMASAPEAAAPSNAGQAAPPPATNGQGGNQAQSAPAKQEQPQGKTPRSGNATTGQGTQPGDKAAQPPAR